MQVTLEVAPLAVKRTGSGDRGMLESELVDVDVDNEEGEDNNDDDDDDDKDEVDKCRLLEDKSVECNCITSRSRTTIEFHGT